MTSKIRGDDNFDSEGIVSGTAKVWVNFDGTTNPPTIRESINVLGITDNGTGDYTVNFETDMPDTNYVVAGSGARSATPANDNTDIASLNIEATSKMLTSSVTVVPSSSNSGGSSNVVRIVDYDTVTVVIFR